MAWQNGVDAGAQTPPYTVPDHRVTDFSARREADANGVVAGFSRLSLAYLHHHARRCPFAVRSRDSEKLTPLLQADVTGLSMGLGHADAERPPALKRTDACGPWRGGLQERDGHQPSPCGDGSRDGACGQACLADTCVSRVFSLQNRPLYTGLAQASQRWRCVFHAKNLLLPPLFT